MIATFLAFLLVLLSSFSVAAVQYGGNRMGGVALPANGDVVQNFQNIPRGPIDILSLHLRITGASTAGGFNLVVDTGMNATAEGVDDLDILLNAAFTNLGLFWEPENLAGNLAPAQWRTILGNFNKADFQGSFVNATAVPAVGNPATTWDITIQIPVSLKRYIFDGTMFSNGSERLKNGQLTFSVRSSTPTAVLANGSLAVTSITEEIKVHHGAGDSGDVGPTWRATRTVGYPTANVLPICSGGRLLLADVLPVATNTATLISIEDYTNWTPLDFQTEYRSTKLIVGGYDISNRCTPYMYMPDDTRVEDFVHYSNKPIRYDMIGPASVGFYDVQTIAASGEAFASVATGIGGGGATSEQNPAVPSLAVGSAIHPALAALMPKRIRPAGAPGANIAIPTHAGQKAMQRVATAAATKSRIRGMLGRKG